MMSSQHLCPQALDPNSGRDVIIVRNVFTRVHFHGVQVVLPRQTPPVSLVVVAFAWGVCSQEFRHVPH